MLVVVSASVFAGLGVAGPYLLSWVGATLLLVLPLPHLLRAHTTRGLAAAGEASLAAGLCCPALLCLAMHDGSAPLLALTAVVLAATCTVSTAISRELQPTP
jgi:hypothetical protein